jgi:hypothetical protein
MTGKDASGDLVRLLKKHKADYLQQIKGMESGGFRTHSWIEGRGLVETTAETLAQIKARLAELEKVLARYPEAN